MPTRSARVRRAGEKERLLLQSVRDDDVEGFEKMVCEWGEGGWRTAMSVREGEQASVLREMASLGRRKEMEEERKKKLKR